MKGETSDTSLLREVRDAVQAACERRGYELQNLAVCLQYIEPEGVRTQVGSRYAECGCGNGACCQSVLGRLSMVGKALGQERDRIEAAVATGMHPNAPGGNPS